MRDGQTTSEDRATQLEALSLAITMHCNFDPKFITPIPLY